jgi:hypothetical protein
MPLSTEWSLLSVRQVNDVELVPIRRSYLFDESWDSVAPTLKQMAFVTTAAAPALTVFLVDSEPTTTLSELAGEVVAGVGVAVSSALLTVARGLGAGGITDKLVSKIKDLKSNSAPADATLSAAQKVEARPVVRHLSADASVSDAYQPFHKVSATFACDV